jgi:hypothetical protein
MIGMCSWVGTYICYHYYKLGSNHTLTNRMTDTSIWRQRRMGTSAWLVLTLPCPAGSCSRLAQRSAPVDLARAQWSAPPRWLALPRALLVHHVVPPAWLARSTLARVGAVAAPWTRVSFHVFCWVFEAFGWKDEYLWSKATSVFSSI